MRHRKCRGLYRAALLLTLVLGAGSGVTLLLRNVPAFAGFLDWDADEPSEYTQKTENLPVDAPLMILSRGYGFREELDPTEPQSEMANAEATDPGPKPYPQEWNLTGGEIHPVTYTAYSGEYYIDLEKAGQVLNKTSVPNSTLYTESKLRPAMKIELHGDPQVLIMHTHTTETYEPYERENYDASFNYRTTDNTKNMVMVGDAITRKLENAGIGVIHDATIHDYPSYTGSYGRSGETVQKILAEYPSIKVVLDIHRDAISQSGIISQPVAEIGGKSAAQVMIISGCDDGTLGMPNYMQNFRFACLLQQQLESDYPGLTRPILFDYRKYNQNLTTGSLLIEVGSHGNTLEQAEYAGELIGASLSRALKGMVH